MAHRNAPQADAAMRHREILSTRWDGIDFVRCRCLLLPDVKAGRQEQPITRAPVETLTCERGSNRRHIDDHYDVE